MARERIAVISDVHGNMTALEAVLGDIEQRGIARVLNLGDVAGKGPRGAQAVRRSRETCEATVRGNWDAYLVAHDEGHGPGIDWWRAELGAAEKAWLAELPGAIDLALSGRRIRLLHASATNEFTRLWHHHSAEGFAAMFENTPFTEDARILDGAGWAAAGRTPDVVGYGDVHDAYLETRDGRTLFNAGSVGNALDEPTAAYAILEGEPGADRTAPFGLQIVRVPYDVEAEIAVARARQMPETEAYAIELRTAVYRGRQAERGLRGR